jgi:exopolyphosphatase/guanosine-5'-triphosphate,3'-diphosphate pyrophosphatase
VRVAAIDVGTNSVHLLVADVGHDGETSVVEKAREQVELGRGEFERHTITPAAMERGVAALVSFKEAMDGLGVEAVTATATSAVREAKNGADFCKAVREATGVHVRTISGHDEARLIYLGVRPELDFSKGYALLVDIGGGSVEMVLCDAHQMLASHSLPLGHIRMAEAMLQGDPPTQESIQRIRAHTRDALRSVTHDIRPGVGGSFVGTSGSVRTLALMATLMRGDPQPPHSHGLVLRRSDLKKLLASFTQLKGSRLGELPGMDTRRRATLPAAAAVLYQLMKTMDRDTLITSDRSLRDGLLADWVLRNEPELSLSRTVAWPRMRSVLRLVDRYDADKTHAQHIRNLALALFDGVADKAKLDSASRRMLEFAALLHDIGHHIDARDHNKHGQYLILNSRMAGFTAPEVALLANIVRYHRGSRPKRSHRHYKALSRANQRRVDVLSAILRLADALDRSHNQPVSDLTCSVEGDQVVVRATARDEVHMEKWAAERRKDALASALGCPVRVELEAAVDPHAFRPAGSDQVE